MAESKNTLGVYLRDAQQRIQCPLRVINHFGHPPRLRMALGMIRDSLVETDSLLPQEAFRTDHDIPKFRELQAGGSRASVPYTCDLFDCGVVGRVQCDHARP